MTQVKPRSYATSRRKPKQLTAKREAEIRNSPYHRRGSTVDYNGERLWCEKERDEVLQHVDWMRAQQGVKTYKAWEAGETSIGDFLKPCDEVDEEMYLHFAEVVPARYDVAGIMQAGEAVYERLSQKHYMTFSCVDERYFYLGILPPFKQPK